MEWDFSKVEVKDFEPRKFTGNECDHDKTIIMKGGRIERSKCSKCDYDVWS